VTSYLLLAAVVYGVALLPIFGPPVWVVLVVAKFRWDLDPVLLVVVGALAATAGRVTLARVSRHLTRWVPRRARENLEAAHEFLDSHEKGVFALLAVFVFSPLPSGQLWVAAGLVRMRLLPLAVAFLVGRAISYAGYVAAATVAEYEVGDVLAKVWGKPWMIALQVVFAVLIVALPLMPWKKAGPKTAS
jgi:uncharacterized membrane protein YdjX (TVP38/TMEM64 family)